MRLQSSIAEDSLEDAESVNSNGLNFYSAISQELRTYEEVKSVTKPLGQHLDIYSKLRAMRGVPNTNQKHRQLEKCSLPVICDFVDSETSIEAKKSQV